MNQVERLSKIAEYIIENGRVTTQELSEKFNVSNQTIRKDLQELELENRIKRIHGGATRKSTFKDRLQINTENKKKLCKKAAELIEDGDFIYIDGGTSYYYLIDYVPSNINITVITCSIPIAKRIMTISNHEVYLLGGIVNPNTLETYSVNLMKEISSMMFSKSFMGVSGFTEEYGFTEENVYSLDVKKKVKENTQVNIVAAGNDKEGKISFKKSFSFEDIDIFVTNSNISGKLKSNLSRKLDLILV